MTIQDLAADVTPVEVVDSIIELHGDNIHYHAITQTWLTYDAATGWTWDRQSSTVTDLAVKTLRHLATLVDGSLDLTRQRKFAKTRRGRCRQMMNCGGLNGILALASKRPELACGDGAIDAETFRIGTPSGVLDLRTGLVAPFARTSIITRRLPVDYDPKASCPRWTRFVAEVLGSGEGVHDYFQELLGYTLSGDTREQKMWLFVGNGANGKSTLLRTMQNLLGGDYAQQTPEAVLFGRQSSGGASSELVRLKGYRCAALTETDYGQSINEERVKKLVSGDTVAARGLYQEYQEFEPQAKYFLATNHLPVVRGSDKGIWRRLVVVPFDHEFEVGSDPTLRSDLEAELPGILAWAVKGAVRWYGNGRLAPLPAAWQDATSKYRGEQDTVRAFLDERAVLSPSATVGATDLFEAFEAWRADEGREVLTQQEFGRRMTSTGLVRRAAKGKGNRKHYFGVKLRDVASTGDVGGLIDGASDVRSDTPPGRSLPLPDGLVMEVTH
jgi:P4 family phage/plasmid primase-like protien